MGALLDYSLAAAGDPEFEAASLAEAKDQVRLLHGADDALLDRLLRAARETLERETGLALVRRAYRLTIDQFPADDYVELPRPPLVAIDEVAYRDSADEEQTWDEANYEADTGRRPGALLLAYGASWPATRPGRNAVTIQYTAGPASAEAVPELAKQALLLLAAHWYAQPEAEVLGAITSEIKIGYERLVRLIKSERYL